MTGHIDNRVCPHRRIISVLCVLALVSVFSQIAMAEERVFALEEVAVSDCPEPVRSRLQRGQYVPECGDVPLPGVTYPEFKSDKPIYGAITFDMSIFDSQAGIRYCFAVDESGGTGTGYDRLYFDLNHDSDLTNDPPVGRMKDVPPGMLSDPSLVLFDEIRVKLDYGADGVWTQAVMPRLMSMGNLPRMFFAVPTARKGKIVLGSEEVELVLAQSEAISGRYDRPMTGVFLTGKDDLLPVLGFWHRIDGTFHRLSATPAGDKIRVEPYSGPFGTLEIGTGGRDIPRPDVDFGFLLSNNACIDLSACTRTDGKWSVPIGDYRLFRLAVRYGKYRVGITADISPVGPKAARPVVFPLRIRQAKPFVFDLPDRLEVVFRNPGDEPVKTGETLRVEAALYLPGTDIMIAALDDTTKKTETVKLPDGREIDLFESLDPTIRIVNFAGQMMAEGVMPFG